MSGHTATMREAAAARWAAAKPVALGLAVGLVAGPVISGLAGFQVRTSTAQAAARDGIVAYLASDAASYITGQSIMVDGGILMR